MARLTQLSPSAVPGSTYGDFTKAPAAVAFEFVELVLLLLGGGLSVMLHGGQLTVALAGPSAGSTVTLCGGQVDAALAGPIRKFLDFES